MSTYEEVSAIIGAVPKFTSEPGLTRVEAVLSGLNHPERKYKSVHIAGTNGKGSVAVLTARLLEEAGYRTGLFISPHLLRINERISVNGVEIADGDFAKEYDILSKVRGPKTEPLGYFEILFCMAADYFAAQNCDYVVFETGLGGRLDATNTVTPEVGIITSIGYDHMKVLGNTIEEIAAEKAGIIKPGVPVVYFTGNEEADRIIRIKAKETKSRAVPVEEAFDGLPEFAKKAAEDFALSQNALYQKDNAMTALVAWDEISCLKDDDDCRRMIQRAFQRFYWPGRMEFIADGILIDGAHNENAVRRFVQSAEALLQRGKWRKISLLFAVCEDKDYEEIIRILCDGLDFEDVFAAELSSGRKTTAAVVGDLFMKYRPLKSHAAPFCFDNVPDAWEKAVEKKTDDTLLVIVGSLYLAGEIKNLQSKDCRMAEDVIK